MVEIQPCHCACWLPKRNAEVDRHLLGVTEYDDGVYLGAALRLVHGVLPYRDFVLVQPPGLILVMTPVAALAKWTGTPARVLPTRLFPSCTPPSSPGPSSTSPGGVTSTLWSTC